MIYLIILVIQIALLIRCLCTLGFGWGILPLLAVFWSSVFFWAVVLLVKLIG